MGPAQGETVGASLLAQAIELGTPSPDADQEPAVAGAEVLWGALLHAQVAEHQLAAPLGESELVPHLDCTELQFNSASLDTQPVVDFHKNFDQDMTNFFQEEIVPIETDSTSCADNQYVDEDDDGWETDCSSSDDPSDIEWLPKNSRPVFLKTKVESEPETFVDNIRRWSVQHKVEQTKVTSLLKILKKFTHYRLPSTARTLLKVPHEKPEIVKRPNFEYAIFNIREQLTTALDNFVDVASLPGLLLNVNIDGISFFRSSQQAWPLLISVYNLKPTFVCMGLFSYGQLPKDLSFMTPVFSQLNALIESGLMYKGKKILVRVGAICCDAPARAKITGTKQHNGFSVGVMHC